MGHSGAILRGTALEAGRSPGSLGDLDDIAILLYTSGTTGGSKGCVYMHCTVQATLVSAGPWVNMTPESVILAMLATIPHSRDAAQHERAALLQAMVVLRKQKKGKVTEEDVVQWAKGKMATYRYPRSVEFIDALPRAGVARSCGRSCKRRSRRRPGQSRSGESVESRGQRTHRLLLDLGGNDDTIQHEGGPFLRGGRAVAP